LSKLSTIPKVRWAQQIDGSFAAWSASLPRKQFGVTNSLSRHRSSPAAYELGFARAGCGTVARSGAMESILG
jgi:hypothetical protein